MINKLTYVLGSTKDPFANLATEEMLLDGVQPGEVILYLWQNHNTVVIGRNQNPWKECRIAEFEEDDGQLARRLSGGGAVFHDTGNLNFTFLAQDGAYDEARQLEVIATAVRSFGLDAQASGRNDITIDGAKFSGNAFYHRGARHYHHGTLMVKVDVEQLGRYLNPDVRKLAAHGVDSVKSRVVNLADLEPSITIESLTDALLEAASSVYQLPAAALPLFRLNPAEQEIRKQRMASWEWRYGETLAFTHEFGQRYPWGNLDVHLVVNKATIQDVRVYSDALDVDFIGRIEAALKDCTYTLAAIDERLAALITESSAQKTIREDCLGCIHEHFE